MALCRLSADRLDESRVEQFVGAHRPPAAALARRCGNHVKRTLH
jgi:hypothetical protein